MIKKRLKRWAEDSFRVTKAAVFWLAVLVCATGVVLFSEHSCVKKTADELLELREEYRTYVAGLKKVLKEQTENSEAVKKKIIVGDVSAEDEFVVVNRESEYLKNSALAFAKQHKLDAVLARTFDGERWETQAASSRKAKKARKRVRRGVRKQAQVVTEEAQEVFERDFLFSWPIDRGQCWLSSRYGWRRLRGRGLKFHAGVDLASPRGTLVKAAAAGIVLESGWHAGYGNYVLIGHNSKYTTRYAHLLSRCVTVGQRVQRGEKVGKVGDTGSVARRRGRDASHLHFEVRAFDKHINPLAVLV